MKVRFNKTVSLGNGIRAHFTKNGVSISQKIGNVTITKKANGKTRKTINIPGTGMSLYDEK